ncbi:MAG: hypothetical protein AB1546_09130 [bacterium]
MITAQGRIVITILAVAIISSFLYFKAVDMMKLGKPKPTIRTGGAVAPSIAKDLQDEMVETQQRQQQPPPAQTAPPAQPPSPPSLAPTQAASSFPDFELLRERFGRSDPFAALHPVEVAEAAIPKESFPNLPPLPPLTIENPPDLQLTAIGMKNGKGTAVINGEVISEGEIIGRYAVDLITSDSVRLVSAFGERVTLNIKQEFIPGYNIRGSEITNIPEELPKKEGVINILPQWPPPPTDIPVSEPKEEKK